MPVIWHWASVDMGWGMVDPVSKLTDSLTTLLVRLLLPTGVSMLAAAGLLLMR